jgi:hypothetical protein
MDITDIIDGGGMFDQMDKPAYSRIICMIFFAFKY